MGEAVQIGNLAVIERLLELMPPEMADNLLFSALNQAINYNHPHVIKKIIAIAPGSIEKMIKTGNYYENKQTLSFTIVNDGIID